MRNMPKAIRYSMMKGENRNREHNRDYPRNETENEINARDPMQYNYESRFRDRTGREHYDNGRFASMRSSHNEHEPYTGADYNEPNYDTRNIGMYSDDGYQSNYREFSPDTGMRRVIGFAPPSMHYTGPSRADEMEHRSGSKERGYSHGDGFPPFDKDTAHMWTRSMKNEDGSQGEHWTMDQTTSILNQRGYKHEPAEWYAIMNAMFSDYYNVAKKYGIAGNAEFYADLANAWLDDKDAVKDKAAAYYAKVVKH